MINDKTKAREILAIENAEHRLVAIKHFGVEHMLSSLLSKVVDRKGEECQNE